MIVRQKDYSHSGKQRKSIFLFAAFQAHLSKIMLKNYGNRNFQWSNRGKRSLLPFHLKGTYLLFAKRRFFALEYLGV